MTKDIDVINDYYFLPPFEMYLEKLLHDFNKKYPLQSLRHINYIIRNAKDEIKDELINLLFKYDMIHTIASLINDNRYNFRNLFDGFIIQKVKLLNFINIPIVIVDLVNKYCEKIDNVDDALQRLCIKILEYISSEERYSMDLIVNCDAVLPSLISNLKKNTTMNVFAYTISTLSNLLVDNEVPLSKIIPKLVSFQVFIDIMLKFALKIECETFAISEILRLCSHMNIAEFFTLAKFDPELQLNIINLLSMLKQSNDVDYKYYLIVMIGKISLRADKALLCDEGLINECIVYVMDNLDQSENNSTIIFEALATINTVSRLDGDSFDTLIDNRLLIVLKRVMASAKCGQVITSIALYILHTIVKDHFTHMQYLLKYDLFRIAYLMLEMSDDNNFNYNKLISLICDSIILASDCKEDIYNHYFKQRDQDFASSMFKLLLCEKTNQSNINRIRIVLRIIAEKCDRIEIDFKKSQHISPMNIIYFQP